MKTVVIVAVFACLATTAAAQSNMEQTQAGPGGDILFSPGLLFPDQHFGGFSFFGSSFGHGMFGRGLLHRSLFFGPRRHVSFFGPRNGDFRFGTGYYSGTYPWWGYNGQFGPQPALYSSQTFVERWRDYNPLEQTQSGSQETKLAQSILLAEGMNEEQVLGAVGSPIQKVTLGERTVWKYSGYSLLFEGGSLKEIR